MHNRVHTLDYVRGLMAVAVMLYHFSYYGGWDSHDPSGLLNKLSIYGVIIFFILSGASLTIAYGKVDFISTERIKLFIFNRFSRIAPLFWLVLILYTCYHFLAKHPPSASSDLALNFALVFGFVYPMPSLIVGGWSIGVEMVMYTFFPLFMIVLQQDKLKAPLLLIVTSFFFVTSFYLLDSTKSIASQWSEYIRPFNHLFFFMLGVYIAKSKKNYGNGVYLFILTLGAVLFSLYSVELEINLITGVDRVLLSICVALFMFGAFHYIPSLPNSVDKILSSLGEISYGVYLLHPIILLFTLGVLKSIDALSSYNLPIFMFVGFMTFVCSFYVYHLYEKPIMRRLRKLY